MAFVTTRLPHTLGRSPLLWCHNHTPAVPHLCSCLRGFPTCSPRDSGPCHPGKAQLGVCPARPQSGIRPLERVSVGAPAAWGVRAPRTAAASRLLMLGVQGSGVVFLFLSLLRVLARLSWSRLSGGNLTITYSQEAGSASSPSDSASPVCCPRATERGFSTSSSVEGQSSLAPTFRRKFRCNPISQGSSVPSQPPGLTPEAAEAGPDTSMQTYVHFIRERTGRAGEPAHPLSGSPTWLRWRWAQGPSPDRPGSFPGAAGIGSQGQLGELLGRPGGQS